MGAYKKVILVPGAAVVNKKGRLDPDQRYKSRLLSALELYEPDSVILISGGTWTTPEAVVGKDYLTRRGIPKDDIIIDATARDTYENIKGFKGLLLFSRLLDRESEEEEVHLVTNRFHKRRARVLCKLHGVDTDVHTTEEVLGKRYERLSNRYPISYVIKNASEMKPGEWIWQLIGEVAAYVDFLFDKIGFHPANKAIARKLGYDERGLVEPPDFKEWDQRFYPIYGSE